MSWLLDPSITLRLPLELVIEIFTLAASSSQQSAISLCLVSSWAREIAQPHLISITVFKDDSHGLVLLRSGPEASSGWPSDTKEIVRLAYLEVLLARLLPQMGKLVVMGHSEAFLASIIYVNTNDLRKGVSPCSAQDMHLTLFGHTGSCWPSIMRMHEETPRSPIYNSVTQLRFVNPFQDGYEEHLERLKASMVFPRLTHFAIPFAYDGGLVDQGPFRFFDEALARLSQTLRLFVLIFYDEEFRSAPAFLKWFREARKKDGRIYFATASREDIQSEWIKEVKGGENLWRRAVRQTREWELSA